MTSRLKSRGTLPKQVHETERFHLLCLWIMDMDGYGFQEQCMLLTKMLLVNT